jgi:hypothetical protein
MAPTTLQRANVPPNTLGAATARRAKKAAASVTSAPVSASGRNRTPASTCMDHAAASLDADSRAAGDVGNVDLHAAGMEYGTRASTASRHVVSRECF